MRRVICFTASFLWIVAAVLAQTDKQQKPASAARQSVKPATLPAAPVKNTTSASKEVVLKGEPNVEAERKIFQVMVAAQAKRKNAEDLVHEWFRRWNAIDGTDESFNKFLELYGPNAMAEVGPNDRQSDGPVMYEGPKAIRKMVGDFRKNWTAVSYSISKRTTREKTAELIQTGEAPWGSIQVAVEFIGGQTNSESKKRFMVRGAAFFEIQDDGKIGKVRTYMPTDERTKIIGPLEVPN